MGRVQVLVFSIYIATLVLHLCETASTKRPCGVLHLKPRVLMNKLEEEEWIVVNRNVRNHHNSNSRVPRVTRSTSLIEPISVIKNGHCSYSITYDIDQDRIPKFLPNATLNCKSCSPLCTSQTVSHHVLVRDCLKLRMRSTRADIWRTSTVSLPFAFTPN
ncbi:uncharacterized protein LOC110243441 [Exaiptasia diaphana]|uniref:Uncharacterized protein n=1 Tax=Exaiptasia diaphana TaxID=2652724 RepID=A0A913XJB0_EXADI|nr:uncharacterized protein LOC110243441 [Exaiptasia diaphana]